jgi:GNAT superfamily N-acetyltransferase
MDSVGIALEQAGHKCLEFATERYRDVIGEGQSMLMAHWAELAVHKDIPLDPEYAFYEKMDDIGALRIYTVRSEGQLIGYSIFVVRPRHAHYNIGWAMNDIVWLHPEHRNEGVGAAFVAFWDQELTALGVTLVHINAKVSHPALAYLLKKCGYVVIEAGYEKRLR